MEKQAVVSLLNNQKSIFMLPIWDTQIKLTEYLPGDLPEISDMRT